MNREASVVGRKAYLVLREKHMETARWSGKEKNMHKCPSDLKFSFLKTIIIKGK